jgi:hypothetical protein
MPTPTRSSKSQRAAERFYANANKSQKITKSQRAAERFYANANRSQSHKKSQRAAERFYANANKSQKATKSQKAAERFYANANKPQKATKSQKAAERFYANANKPQKATKSPNAHKSHSVGTTSLKLMPGASDPLGIGKDGSIHFVGASLSSNDVGESENFERARKFDPTRTEGAGPIST